MVLERRCVVGVVHCWPIKDSTDRWYQYEETGEKAPGVSSIIDVVRKPRLETWKISNVSAYAAANIAVLSAADEQERAALMLDGAGKDTRQKMQRGTEVHALCEQTLRAVIAGKKPRFRATPDDLRYLRNFARWIKEFDVRPVATELAVWSVGNKYAGRLDLLAWLKIDGEPVLSIVDYKTGASGVWPEAALQQCAYMHADHHINDVGEMVFGWPINNGRENWPIAAFALWLRPDGKAMIPLDTGQSTWEEFKRRRKCYDWQLQCANKVVGKAINENPLRRKWQGVNH